MPSNFPSRAPVGLITGILVGGALSSSHPGRLASSANTRAEVLHGPIRTEFPFDKQPVGTWRLFSGISQSHYQVLVQNGHLVSGVAGPTLSLSVHAVQLDAG